MTDITIAEAEDKNIPNNIVMFPKAKQSAPTSIEEAKNNFIISKIEIAEFLAEEVTKEIFRILSDQGYQIKNVQDMAFVLLTLKATIMRYDDIYHPIQTLIDENIFMGTI
jgi:hypothetical protein